MTTASKSRITNPANPTPVTALTDKEDGGYDILQGAEDIAIIHANGLVYALVTARMMMVFKS